GMNVTSLSTAPRPWSELPESEARGVTGVLTDIDDTLTTDGRITPDALAALAQLKAAGLHVIAITGRPMGWSEPFARDWPIDAIMTRAGMNATVSSIHINGWFGEHTKLSGARWIVQRLFVQDLDARHWVYVGDSTNDQLMFGHFPLSVGVANLMAFADVLTV